MANRTCTVLNATTASTTPPASAGTQRRRVTAAVAVTVLTRLALSGCTDPPPEPAPFDPPTATDSTTPGGSPSESPSPSETVTPAPVLPDAATGATAESAEAFVRFYIDLINHAARTGDTTAMRQYATPECTFCSDAAAVVDEIYAAGGHIQGQDSLIVERLADPRSDGTSASVIAVLTAPETAVVPGLGESPTPQPSGTQSYGVRLTRADDAWLISEVVITQ